MATPRAKSSSILTYRAKTTIALPPATLGYSNLVDPETFDPDKPKLTMNAHYTPAGIHALQDTIREKVYTEDAIAKLIEECEANKVKLPTEEPKDPEAWLEALLKEPKPEFPIQLPFIKLANNLYYFKWTDGEKVQKTRAMQVWTHDNKKLNLKRLKLGRGSVIEPVVYPNLFFSKVIGVIQPSLKLVGLRVLELVQYEGGNGAPPEADDEAIREVLGRDFKAVDLSAYMGLDDEEEDGDEGAPVQAPEGESPADKAKGMF